MERGVCMKEMIHFKTVCGANNVNPQFLFYDDHDNHFNYSDIHILRSHYIKPFVLKACDSGNYQPNYNGPNLKLNGIYGKAIMNWQRQHVTLKFENSNINDVLVETWRSFQLLSPPIIIKTFNKKIVYPSPHLMKTPTPKPFLYQPKLPKGVNRRELK